eukprot:gb/GECG01010059.1/.p1 GENE.gb/GECG01010059.1/~~gb/GECG01010059.1/.p1  ORF type:complete len:105 (+),score=11.87 gb/GECG01010059.1/:1-315(+)
MHFRASVNVKQTRSQGGKDSSSLLWKTSKMPPTQETPGRGNGVPGGAFKSAVVSSSIHDGRLSTSRSGSILYIVIRRCGEETPYVRAQFNQNSNIFDVEVWSLA